MTELIALGAFLASFIAFPILLGVLRFLGAYDLVPERHAHVYVLFGQVLAVLDEPGIYCLWTRIGLKALILRLLGKRHVVDPWAVLSDFGRKARYALEEGATHVNRLGDTRNVIVRDPVPVLDRISERYHLDDGEKEAMHRAFHREPGDTLFSVIQAVTGSGNDPALGIESREKLQELGGRLLELASSGRRWIDQ